MSPYTVNPFTGQPQPRGRGREGTLIGVVQGTTYRALPAKAIREQPDPESTYHIRDLGALIDNNTRERDRLLTQTYGVVSAKRLEEWIAGHLGGVASNLQVYRGGISLDYIAAEARAAGMPFEFTRLIIPPLRLVIGTRRRHGARVHALPTTGVEVYHPHGVGASCLGNVMPGFDGSFWDRLVSLLAGLRLWRKTFHQLRLIGSWGIAAGIGTNWRAFRDHPELFSPIEGLDGRVYENIGALLAETPRERTTTRSSGRVYASGDESDEDEEGICSYCGEDYGGCECPSCDSCGARNSTINHGDCEVCDGCGEHNSSATGGCEHVICPSCGAVNEPLGPEMTETWCCIACQRTCCTRCMQLACPSWSGSQGNGSLCHPGHYPSLMCSCPPPEEGVLASVSALITTVARGVSGPGTSLFMCSDCDRIRLACNCAGGCDPCSRYLALRYAWLRGGRIDEMPEPVLPTILGQEVTVGTDIRTGLITIREVIAQERSI